MKIICSMMSISGDQIACCHWLRGSATEKLTHVSQQAATNSANNSNADAASPYPAYKAPEP